MADIIAFGIERWGEPVAERYSDDLLAAFARLAEHPRLGVSAERVGRDLRRLSCGRHVGFYTITEDAVIVHRILHMSQEPTRYLP